MRAKEDEYYKKLWHSTAHVLASAVKELWPDAKLGIGPAIKQGFYYDFDVERPFTPEDLAKIEKKMKEIIKRKERFIRKEISKKEAEELFKDEPYKLELLKGLEGPISIYKNGNFIDLCKGPHVENTAEIKAFKLLRTAGAYWRGSERNPMLQRIYGISFKSKKELEDYLKRLKELGERNHIKLGKQLEIFSTHEEAPGFPFFLPNGTIIWDEIVNFCKRLHIEEGYKFITTPIILSKDLWVRSGHWDHYRKNMYFTEIDERDFAVKPMNCPGHILVYKEKRHSYREFPLKIAEFGIVHRHERSGVLHGLFRVRKFTQDDAHIFCTEEQLKDEIINVINLTKRIYKAFGFNEYGIELSTRPEDSMGTDEQWEHATNALKQALEELKIDYKINEGEGAFYGPKIDFHITDALEREWQCATIQVDFSMPEKFDLYYIGPDDKKHRPVMIHRAILGSIERFMGVLIEHYAGNFPTWLSPTQVKILPITDRNLEYAKKVLKELLLRDVRAELDDSRETLSKKIRQAQLEKIPYMLVVGDNEQKQGSVTVRTRKGAIKKNMPLEEFIDVLCKEISNRALELTIK
ncbi:MAG: threonine--tRNA ligase [Candidatus Iainarchaeum archaeon]|uniref:Threonine--tRNA ligase n=1 Tax=Candidatus Iainarchaeum sp. TaxID=3101447 RepID=A0A497JJI7_9ARCH|nr:MAG: threonine--tRNA ligase [Candidatus Diapherotrites archaeon]